MKEESLKFKKSLVASIDVLGAKKYLDGDKAEMFLSALHTEFNKIEDEVKELDSTYSAFYKHKFKVFSDNIAIVREYSNQIDIALHLHKLACFISSLQARLFDRYGLLSRGGIAIGDCFIDENMVLGKALVDAYELESELAIYPRVILSPSLCQYANTYLFSKSDFSKDNDGFMYVDYISLLCEKVTSQKVISTLENHLKNDITNKIRQKYAWLFEKTIISHHDKID